MDIVSATARHKKATCLAATRSGARLIRGEPGALASGDDDWEIWRDGGMAVPFLKWPANSLCQYDEPGGHFVCDIFTPRPASRPFSRSRVRQVFADAPFVVSPGAKV